MNEKLAEQLEEVNKDIQSYLQKDETVFKIMKRFESGTSGTGFMSKCNGIEVPHKLLNEREFSRELKSFDLIHNILKEHGEVMSINRMQFTKNGESLFKKLNHLEVEEYIIQKIRQEMKGENAHRAQNMAKFTPGKSESISCQGTLFINNDLKTKKYGVYYEIDRDLEILDNLTKKNLKSLFIEVTDHSYSIFSNPPVEELGWKDIKNRELELSPELLKRDEAIKKSIELRTNFYNKFGQVHSDVLTPIISPMFTGGHPWPAGRPQFRHIIGKKSTIIISDGLSNCFEEEYLDEKLQYNGFGLELYFEFKGHIPIETFYNHYCLKLLSSISQNAINHGNFAGLFKDLGPVSIEFSDGDFPDQYQDSEGKYIVLMNASSENIPKNLKLNKEKVVLAGCKLLDVNYFEYCEDEKSRKVLDKELKKKKAYCYNPLEF